MTLPTVAIVGRPNVGKSTLFNRIAGERISIVEDVEGVTRDRIYTSAEWLNRQFSLIDTGGIDDVDAPFMEQIKHQADIAMTEADVIVFVVSGKEGVTDADEYVARILYKTNKPVILAVNKVDNPEMRADIYDLRFVFESQLLHLVIVYTTSFLVEVVADRAIEDTRCIDVAAM